MSSRTPEGADTGLLVNSKFQLKLLTIGISLAVLICAVFYGVAQYSFAQERSLAMLAGITDNDAYFQRVGELQSQVNLWLFVLSVAALVIVGLTMWVVSARISRPISLITEELLDERDEAICRPIKLDKPHYFPELTAAFNRRLLRLHSLARSSPERLVELYTADYEAVADRGEPSDGNGE